VSDKSKTARAGSLKRHGFSGNFGLEFKHTARKRLRNWRISSAFELFAIDREKIRNRGTSAKKWSALNEANGIFLTQNAKEVSSNFLKLSFEGEGQKPSPPYIPPQPPQGGQNFAPASLIIRVVHDARDFTLR
jgi:hypothetical protein